MKQVSNITVDELQEMAAKMYGDFVKAVVDVKKKLVVVDVEMHYDAEQYLLEQGSKQYDLWGINLYPSAFGTDEFIEYDSMINLRPNHGNSTRGVEDDKIRQTIVAIISEKVHA